jgi:FtsZ-binding cell division protein ZapB
MENGLYIGTALNALGEKISSLTSEKHCLQWKIEELEKELDQLRADKDRRAAMVYTEITHAS